MAMSPRLMRPRQTSRYAALRAGLSAYWPLNETASSGNVSAVNYFPAGTSLTSVNSALSATGIQGNAREFARASSQRLYASISGQPSLTLLGPSSFTIAFWFRCNGNYTNANTYGLMSNDAFPSERGLAIALPAGALASGSNWPTPYLYYFYTDGTQETVAPFAGAIAKDVWHFLCVRRSGNTVSARLDGNWGTQKTLSKTPLSSRANLHAGIRYGGSGSGSDYFNGRVDEIAMWSRAITDSEVSTLYNNGLGIDLRT